MNNVKQWVAGHVDDTRFEPAYGRCFWKVASGSIIRMEPCMQADIAIRDRIADSTAERVVHGETGDGTQT